MSSKKISESQLTNHGRNIPWHQKKSGRWWVHLAFLGGGGGGGTKPETQQPEMQLSVQNLTSYMNHTIRGSGSRIVHGLVEIIPEIYLRSTPPWNSPLKIDGWKTTFLLGCHLVKCYVGFREDISLQHKSIYSSIKWRRCWFSSFSNSCLGFYWVEGRSI